MPHQPSQYQGKTPADYPALLSSRDDEQEALHSRPTHLHAHADLASRALESMPAAVVVTDFDGHIMYWNPGAERFYGWTAAEALGRNALELMSTEEVRDRTLNALTIMRDRESWTRDLIVQRKDGTLVPAEITLSQIRDDAGQPIGVVGMSIDVSDRKQSERERETLLTREHTARLEAKTAQQRAEQLLLITAAYSRARTPDEVIQVTVEQGLAALGADAGIVALLNEADNTLEIKQTTGYAPEALEPWRSQPIPMGTDYPLTDAVLRQESIWIRSREELFESYPTMPVLQAAHSSSAASIPIMVNGHTLGVLGLRFASAHEFSPAERIFGETIARLCAQALERAYLFAGERFARVAAEDAQQRLTLLAETSNLLTTSLDLSDTLAATAQLIVPRMADWCVVDVVDSKGLPERISVAHTDPERVRWAEELQQRYPYNPNATGGLAQVLRTGQTMIYPTITDEMLVASAQDDEQLEILRTLGFSSVMFVPMIARGRTVGALTLVHAESGRHYSGGDVAVIENLAHRAALAIDNARLFEQAQIHAVQMDTLAEVSQGMAEANLDLTTILETISLQVARLVGDFVVIRLPSEDRKWLQPVAVYHPDPEAEAALRKMFDENPLAWSEGITGRVATSGESLWIPETSPAHILDSMKPDYRSWTEQFGMYSILIVPMRRRQQVIGTIAAFRITPGHPYSESDRRFVQELADRAALSVENAQLYREAQEAIRLREEFLSIASHEVRTPLTTITGFTHLLSRFLKQEPINHARIDTITASLLSEAQRLNQLVGDLLDMSRFQQGRLDLRLEDVDLSVLARDVAERLRVAQDPSSRRAISVEAPEPVIGFWDAARLDQVVTNLVSNALKYSTEGDITIQVNLDGSDAVLSVSDRGVGIPRDQQARLFEPFERGESAHHLSGGAGLGLYITRQIVEHLGGSISVTSAPNAGSTFTVRLPLSPEQ